MRPCPSCQQASEETASECPGCGIIFAKWEAMQQRAASAPAPGPKEGGGSSGFWTAAALIVLAAAGGWQHFKGAKSGPEPGLSPFGKKILQQALGGRGAKGSQGAPARDQPAGPGHAVEMRYVAEAFPMGLSTWQSSALNFNETPEGIEGFKKMPPETGKARFYDEFDIAGATFRVITEAGDPWKFHLDANHNGDMTDDPGPFNGERAGVAPNHYTLMLPYPNEKISAEYRLWIFPSNMGGTKFYAACYTAGELSDPKWQKKYKLALFDGNPDGDYSNDSLVIDVNDDGKAQETELLAPGKSMTIEGTTITLRWIAASGRKVVFAPFD